MLLHGVHPLQGHSDSPTIAPQAMFLAVCRNYLLKQCSLLPTITTPCCYLDRKAMPDSGGSKKAPDDAGAQGELEMGDFTCIGVRVVTDDGRQGAPTAYLMVYSRQMHATDQALNMRKALIWRR